MDIEQSTESITNDNEQKQTKRYKLIENVLDLSVNSGKMNSNTNYILYSKKSKEEKRQKIKETEEILYRIMENVANIADSLELSMKEIYNKNIK